MTRTTRMKARNLWKLMRVQDAAKFFGVHPQTVYRWVLRGRIPAIKLGGRWFLKIRCAPAVDCPRDRAADACPDGVVSTDIS